MANYDFTDCLSPLDFELLSKDLLEADLGIKLENFREGRDQGIDLRYAPVTLPGRKAFNSQTQKTVIVQCKRYSTFANLKSELKNKELAKITKLNPARYILTASVSLSPKQVDELKELLSPFVLSSGDIYGRDRLNTMLSNHQEIERRHIKLWVSSTGVIDSIIHASTHIVSREEVERTVKAAKLYVRNTSFDEALTILKENHVCIISGLPGIGKTTLARMLLLYFYQREYDIVKIESDISEARAVGYHYKPRFYYYDDFLGQTAQADKLNKNEDQKLLDFMASIRDSKDSVFVLTTREYILNQAKIYYEKLAREKFDHRTCIIDLSKYSRRIRAQILYNHLYYSKLPSAFIKALLMKRGYLEIVDHKNYNPRIIKYLTDSTWLGEISSSEYLEFFLQKLNNPVDIWEHAFRNQLSDRARHLLFILTTMPTESYIEDVKFAFNSFHYSQCMKFSIAHSENDFISALKELDGTFAATHKVQDFVSISFQNPSIRDFMQNLLLCGEMLSEVIESIVFFEQARWFVETLNEENPQVLNTTLIQLAPQIADALKRLVDTKSHAIQIAQRQKMVQFTEKSANTAARLVTIALFFTKQMCLTDKVWMTTKIYELITDLELNRIPISAFLIDSIEKIKNLGYLDADTEKKMANALKMRIITNYSDLYDLDFYGFEILIDVIDTFPQYSDEKEMDSIRDAYSDFIVQYAQECDFTNPEEFREEASRIQLMGDVLEVDTKKAQDTLRNAAEEIEEKQQEQWDDFDDDDNRRAYNNIFSNECSDKELDSMFGTLGI
jgi:hypothetical protein